MERISAQIAVVGGGPAGLATACWLQEAGYSTVVLEKGILADSISKFPTYMTFFSTADLVELCGFAFTIAAEKPTRREYLLYLRRFVRDRRIEVRQGRAVEEIRGACGAFELEGRDRLGRPFVAAAERVVLALGAFGSPQMLGIPGEDSPHVTHFYKEAHGYFGSRVAIIGGGNSAVETALELWRAGIEVCMIHRRAKFKTLKYWIEPDIENRIKNGAIKAYRPARALEIRPESILIEPEGEPAREIAADAVIIQTGYRPDARMLARFGVAADPQTGRPAVDPETLESGRPGLYIVGVMLAGNVSSEIFIENSRLHGERILARLRAAGGLAPRGAAR